MVKIGVVNMVVGGVVWWWRVVFEVVGVVVGVVGKIIVVVLEEVEELFFVGVGEGGIAGCAHFCPYVGVIGDKMGGVVAVRVHLHLIVFASSESGGVVSHG